MDCNYALNSPAPCANKPTNLIIWGCLEQHIMEFITCPKHLHQWINAHHTGQISCAFCYNPSAAFITNDLYYIDTRKLHI
jgi:hypothetical protein